MKKKIAALAVLAFLAAGCATVRKIADTLEASAGIIDGAADDMTDIWDTTGGAVLPDAAPETPK